MSAGRRLVVCFFSIAPEISARIEGITFWGVRVHHESDVGLALAGAVRTRYKLIGKTMTTKSTGFKETMTRELNDFIQSQACALSLAELDRLLGEDMPIHVWSVKARQHAEIAGHGRNDFLRVFAAQAAGDVRRRVAAESLDDTLAPVPLFASARVCISQPTGTLLCMATP